MRHTVRKARVDPASGGIPRIRPTRTMATLGGVMNQPGDPEQRSEQHVMVVGPGGSPLGAAKIPDGEDGQAAESVGDMVEQPAKVMRIGTMIKQLLEEVRAAPPDAASRNRLREIHKRSIAELEDGLAPELRDELERLSLPFGDDGAPSEAEQRVAQE